MVEVEGPTCRLELRLESECHSVGNVFLGMEQRRILAPSGAEGMAGDWAPPPETAYLLSSYGKVTSTVNAKVRGEGTPPTSGVKGHL